MTIDIEKVKQAAFDEWYLSEDAAFLDDANESPSTISKKVWYAAWSCAKLLSKNDKWIKLSDTPAPLKGFFLVCCDDPKDPRPAMAISGSMFKQMTDPSTPEHLSLRHMTHWMEFPNKQKKEGA